MLNVFLTILFGELPPGVIIIPRDKFDADIKVYIEVINDTFLYQYTIKNLQTSEQKIWAIDIIKPVIVDTLILYEIGYSNSKWEFGYVKNRSSKYLPYFYFGHYDSSTWVCPGDSIMLWFKSDMLPYGDYWMYMEGYAPPPRFPVVPPEDWEEVYGIKYWTRTPYGPGKIYYTIGPGPLPPGFWEQDTYYVGSDALNHLRGMVSLCGSYGWITKKQIEEHLVNLILRAKKHYEAGRYRLTRQVLSQTIEYIGNYRSSSILDNGYYILYYRTKFVKEHLWCPE